MQRLVPDCQEATAERREPLNALMRDLRIQKEAASDSPNRDRRQVAESTFVSRRRHVASSTVRVIDLAPWFVARSLQVCAPPQRRPGRAAPRRRRQTTRRCARRARAPDDDGPGEPASPSDGGRLTHFLVEQAQQRVTLAVCRLLRDATFARFEAACNVLGIVTDEDRWEQFGRLPGSLQMAIWAERRRAIEESRDREAWA